METRVEKAVERKHSGCNCAQAIACTYCDHAGVDEETMKIITQAFGTGMGTMEGSCGALSGAAVVLGMTNKDQKQTVSGIREIMAEFKKRNGTVTCKELKGVGTGKVLRSCDDCVRDSAEFLEKKLAERM